MMKYLFLIFGVVFISGCAAEKNSTYTKNSQLRREIIKVPSSINSSFDYERAAILLRRTSFGVVPGQIADVENEGAAKYLDEQLNPQFIDDSECDSMISHLPALSMTPKELYENYPPPFVIRKEEGKDAKIYPKRSTGEILVELEAAKLVRDVYSKRQLQDVMTDFWLNHFNIYAIKSLVPYYLVDFTRRVRENALGKFSDLLKSVATSPAMLLYLDNTESADPNFIDRKRLVLMKTRRELGPFAERRAYLDKLGAAFFTSKGLNENYGRELLELHTVGLNYAQQDVINAARSLTGWTVAPIQDGGGFLYDDAMHDKGPKKVLGLEIPPDGGFDDGMKLLDYLANNPMTAHFISYELCRRFVSDNPPEELVDKAAQTFLNTGGDIKKVLLTTFLSRDFTSRRYYKYKNPYEYVVSAIRASNASFFPSKRLFGLIRSMGLVPYFVNSPKGYSENSRSWMDADILLKHSNFALALADNRIKGINIDYDEIFTNGNADTPRVLEKDFSDEVIGVPLDSTTQKVIEQESEQGDMPLPEIYALLLNSPEFQRR
ncbi:MAG: DUF1800 domain-containing protein [Bacteroidetes bacterium]|nr:DUF1800 domain-containing protein [Bacteroidota bacterium]MCL5739146.1 DUF1800 domain-containing protein [Bacteroidota bacterium]